MLKRLDFCENYEFALDRFTYAVTKGFIVELKIMRLKNFDDFIPFGEKGIVYQDHCPTSFESFTPSRCGILEGIERAAIFAGKVLNTVGKI